MEKGLELIKEVADLLKLQMSVFDDVKYVHGIFSFFILLDVSLFLYSLSYKEISALYCQN